MAKKSKGAVFAVHAFMATKDIICEVCGQTIPKSGHYINVEPTDRKKPAFNACIPCAGKVRKS